LSCLRPATASSSTASGYAGARGFTSSPWAYGGKVLPGRRRDDARAAGGAGVQGAGPERAGRDLLVVAGGRGRRPCSCAPSITSIASASQSGRVGPFGRPFFLATSVGRPAAAVSWTSPGGLPVAKKKRSPGPRRPSPRLLAQLDAAEGARGGRQWDEAERVAGGTGPPSPAPAPTCWPCASPSPPSSATCARINRFAEQLIELLPDDRELPVVLAGSYLSTGRIALGLRACATCWHAQHEHRADQLRGDTSPAWNRGSTNSSPRSAWAGRTSVSPGRTHEQVAAPPRTGRIRRGPCRRRRGAARAAGLRRRAEQRRRGLRPRGRLRPGPSATVRRVFEFAPGQRLRPGGCSTRASCSGRPPRRPRRKAGRLKALTPARHDEWLKVAEALSFLGDDAGAAGRYAGAQRCGRSRAGGDGGVPGTPGRRRRVPAGRRVGGPQALAAGLISSRSLIGPGSTSTPEKAACAERPAAVRLCQQPVETRAAADDRSNGRRVPLGAGLFQVVEVEPGPTEARLLLERPAASGLRAATRRPCRYAATPARCSRNAAVPPRGSRPHLRAPA